MKHLSAKTIILAATLVALPVTLCAASGGKRQQYTQKAETYFSDILSGRQAGNAADRKIKPGETAEWQQLVWQAWLNANNANNEERLARLAPLGDKTRGQWLLPDSLEPNAHMPYFYGKKEAKNEPNAINGRLPLFVYLHGSGPKEQEWTTGLKLAQRFDDAPSIYFIPQIPNEGRYYRWWLRSKQWAWEKLLRQSLASDDTDPNRIYIFGISEGGYGSQRLASFYADYLAAAGPMAGGEPLRNAPAENCSGIGFSFLTGAQDAAFFRNRFTHDALAAFDSLHTAYPDMFKHRIELIPGRGHHIDYSPTTPWLSRFTRNPYPKHFLWEDFAMDGRHRNGFYNLRVDQRQQLDSLSRTRYTVDIDDNVIRINVQTVSYEILQLDPYWHTIEMAHTRHYTPAGHCSFTVFLNDKLVDMNRKVTVIVNDRRVFCGTLQPRLRNMIESTATFYDPYRIYPAAVHIKI